MQIFKAPKTDKDNMKKSQKGKVAVVLVDGEYKLIDELDGVTVKAIEGNQLETVFLNGKLVKEESMAEIRKRLGAIE